MLNNPVRLTKHPHISDEADLVRNALIEYGLETSMFDKGLSQDQKYNQIRDLMSDMMQVLGLSKINRIVRYFSQRPQVKECLARQILLDTEDVAVSIEATHYCLSLQRS
jgi:hypothetical protein